jgi:hypothetical protein
MSLVDSIKQALKAVWNWIKKIFVKVLSFTQNIKNWFKQPDKLKKIQDDKNVIAITIKENLANGNYNLVNCLFNEEDETLVDYQESTLSIEAENLDMQTISIFGNKEMIKLT